MLHRRWLGVYAAVFAAAGAAFLALPGVVTGLLSVPGAGASLWLGLAGSLMAVLTLLAWELSRDPAQAAVWRALLLSKAVSSALFIVFARQGGPGYLAAALVDGALLLHLAFLREAHEPLCAWEPRLPIWPVIRHEAFFLIFRDPASQTAFWLRHEADREGGRCQWAVTDKEGVRQGSWEEKPFAGFTRNGSKAAGPEGAWGLSWEDGPVRPYALVPRWLWRLGLAGSMYVTSAPAASFSGVVELGGRRWTLEGAPGCVGHLWGRRHGARWRWAHATWPERGLMAETLAAQGRLGLWRTPLVSTAALWKDGNLSLTSALGGPATEGGTWSF
ncbi:MAG: hypothetical protein FD126_3307, partial [Elusimicrobia bacterium]